MNPNNYLEAKNMTGRILAIAIRLLTAYVPVQDVKEAVDDMMDKLEDKFKGNQSVIDGLAYVRRVLDIPDDIGGDED